MKKKIIFIIILGILICVIFLIPKDTYKKIFGKDTPEDKVVHKENVYVFMKRDDQLVGVNAMVDAIEEDEITQKFDILTKKTGAFNFACDTYINPATKLIDYEVLEKTLKLNLSEEFNESQGRKTLEQIVWTFCNDDISSIEISVDNNRINKLNDYHFDKLTKDMGINLTLETVYLFEASSSTIFDYGNECLVPVTYFYQGVNTYNFIINKLFGEIKDENYTFKVNNDEIVIEVMNDTPLTELQKQSIVETIKYNLNIENITIQGIESVLLEIKKPAE